MTENDPDFDVNDRDIAYPELLSAWNVFKAHIASNQPVDDATFNHAWRIAELVEEADDKRAAANSNNNNGGNNNTAAASSSTPQDDNTSTGSISTDTWSNPSLYVHNTTNTDSDPAITAIVRPYLDCIAAQLHYLEVEYPTRETHEVEVDTRGGGKEKVDKPMKAVPLSEDEFRAQVIGMSVNQQIWHQERVSEAMARERITGDEEVWRVLKGFQDVLRWIVRSKPEMKGSSLVRQWDIEDQARTRAQGGLGIGRAAEGDEMSAAEFLRYSDDDDDDDVEDDDDDGEDQDYGEGSVQYEDEDGEVGKFGEDEDTLVVPGGHAGQVLEHVVVQGGGEGASGGVISGAGQGAASRNAGDVHDEAGDMASSGGRGDGETKTSEVHGNFEADEAAEGGVRTARDGPTFAEIASRAGAPSLSDLLERLQLGGAVNLAESSAQGEQLSVGIQREDSGYAEVNEEAVEGVDAGGDAVGGGAGGSGIGEGSENAGGGEQGGGEQGGGDGDQVNGGAADEESGGDGEDADEGDQSADGRNAEEVEGEVLEQLQGILLLDSED